MLIEYVAIGFLIALTILVAVIAIGLGMLFGPKHQTARKSAPYESGMNPIGPGNRRMPVRYYLVAVFSSCSTLKWSFSCPGRSSFRQLGLFGLIEMVIFIAILLVGYIYAWKKGALEWE